MKGIFSKFIFLSASVISVGLVGCSTNTQNENTGIGAVTGGVAGGLVGGLAGGSAAAVGIGVVGGALLGGFIGHSMDSSDNSRMYNSMEHNPTNKSTTWKNTTTGQTYTIAPTSSRMVYRDNPNCRRYYATAIINGSKQKISGIACRRADGVWESFGG